MKNPENIFFLGKGGVGKSTSSALNALFLAKEMNRKVFLVSMDPAHNQSDILGMNLSQKPKKICNNFFAAEIDEEAWIKRYLKEVQGNISRTYSYLTAFNLDGYFKIMRHAPGLEEYALVLAFKKFQEDYRDFDFLIFDMPPTALSLKFFSLPSLSLIWIDHLLSLRREILKKKKIISKIKLIKNEHETDKVLNKIIELKEDYRNLEKIFQDMKRTKLCLVLNPDLLSSSESERIVKNLDGIGMRVAKLILNKTVGNYVSFDENSLLSPIPLEICTLSSYPLIGIKALSAFISENK